MFTYKCFSLRLKEPREKFKKNDFSKYHLERNCYQKNSQLQIPNYTLPTQKTSSSKKINIDLKSMDSLLRSKCKRCKNIFSFARL